MESGDGVAVVQRKTMAVMMVAMATDNDGDSGGGDYGDDGGCDGDDGKGDDAGGGHDGRRMEMIKHHSHGLTTQPTKETFLTTESFPQRGGVKSSSPDSGPYSLLNQQSTGKRCHVTSKSGSEGVLQPSCPAALLGHPGSPRPRVSLATRRARHWEGVLGHSPR